MENEKRRCPYCGEEILETAVKCKHCQSWLKKKCPFCAEMIDSNLYKCPFCDSDLTQSSQKEQTINSKVREKKENRKANESWKVVLLLIFIFVGAGILLSSIFSDLFVDKIIFTNPLTGEQISIPVKDGDPIKTYQEPRALFYNSYIVKYDAAKTSLLNAKIAAQMCTDGPATQEEVDECVYKTLYEKDAKSYTETDETIIQTAVNEYKKEKHKEEAIKFGISVACYERFRPIYMQKGDKISLEEIPCSKKEGQSIKNQLRKEEEEFNNREYALDDIEVVYGNAGMPKSLVLKGVPIICFEHANIGDNSKCTPKQLDTINQFFKQKNIDWENEYFDYLDD